MNSFLISGGSPNQQLDKIIQLLSSRFQLHIPVSQLQFPSSNPDIYLTDNQATSIGIEEARKIISFCSLKPYQSHYQVVLIAQAENATLEAQNALLKTLEEPPKSCLIFLTTLHPDLIIPTVVSRCELIQLPQPLPRLTEKEIEDYHLLLDQLLKAPLGKALALSDTATLDKSSAVAFCQSLIISLQPRLARQGQALSGKKAANLIRILQQTLVYLNSNTQLRLTIDNLVLSLQNAAQAD